MRYINDFIGKRVNVETETDTFSDMELMSVDAESGSILLYDPDGKVNYYIPERRIVCIDDDIHEEEEENENE